MWVLLHYFFQITYYLSSLLTEQDLVSSPPWLQNMNGYFLYVTEELRLGLDSGDQRNSYIPKPLVDVTHCHQHRDFPNYAMDGLWVAALKQLVLILEYGVVQLLVTWHHGGGEEQVGLEHFPIPTNQKSYTILAYISLISTSTGFDIVWVFSGFDVFPIRF